MKVALCLSGITGGDGGKDGKGKSLDLIEPYNSVKENILDSNDVDVFMHSWSLESKPELIDIYKPKKYKFEEQIKFDEVHRKHIVKSRFYSNQKSLNLKKEYEIKNKFKYDWVMISRFDLVWFNKLIFDEYDNRYFYASNWNHNGRDNLGPFDKQTQAGTGLLDFRFFSRSENMDEYAEGCYPYLIDNFFETGGGKNVVSGHRVSKLLVDSNGFELKNVKYRGYDHEMYRRYKKKGWRLK